MNRIFFISDCHFDHEAILQYDKRPFKTIEEMRNTMIQRWNQSVNKADTVYILGDFTWSSNPDEIVDLLNRLNGNKLLIKGNHDRRTSANKVKNAFGQYIKEIDSIQVNGRKIVLSHYPIASWKQMQRKNPEENAILLYGHVHLSDEFLLFEQYLDRLREMKRVPIQAYNVGAMCPWMDYQPRTLDEIVERYSKMKDYLFEEEYSVKGIFK